MNPEALGTLAEAYRARPRPQGASFLASLDPLTRAQIQAESSWNPRAVSRRGAVGLMQLLPSTARFMAQRIGMRRYDLTNPEHNVRLGQAYMDYLRQRFGGRNDLALAAYNWGETRLRQAIAKHGEEKALARAPQATRAYVRRVMASIPPRDLLAQAPEAEAPEVPTLMPQEQT